MSNKFIEVPATKRSITLRGLVLGYGTNDADYDVNTTINGKSITCPYYERWAKMLTRCFSKKYHETRPTYIGCTVCDEWLTFSNFKRWMACQDWQGKDLDKDIIHPGNKRYSPDACTFILPHLNCLLTDRRSARGKYPRGVSKNKSKVKLEARVSYKGGSIHLGHFTCEIEASNAYISKKAEIILEAAAEQSDPRVSNGLRLHVDILLAGLSG